MAGLLEPAAHESPTRSATAETADKTQLTSAPVIRRGRIQVDKVTPLLGNFTQIYCKISQEDES